MNALDLLAHLRRRTPRPAEPRPDDHVAADVSPPKPDEGSETTPAPPAPPRPSPPRTPVPARLPRRTWLNAELTVAEQIREERVLDDLADLTRKLGSPLAAAQHEFAPHHRKDT